MKIHKEQLLKNLALHIHEVREKISVQLEKTKKLVQTSLEDLRKMAPQDQVLFMNLRADAENRFTELAYLESAPYFMKCIVIDDVGREKHYFFSKYQFSEESIFSWVAPIASIRFENPGLIRYQLPNGVMKTVTLVQKEQYMIVDGKVLFFALENKEHPRELIFQEHFTRHKSEFALPEIVAQIEKAQDQVIRARSNGPLVICGPAGSGKTTLALHRVAYLTQAPETADLYPSKLIVVFVQDVSTKKYFSGLLPSLGIHNVNITTFHEWAMLVLNLNDYVYTEKYGDTESEKEQYEYEKLLALRHTPSPVWDKKIFATLSAQYQGQFSVGNKKLFDRQEEEKILDRFDLTILLKAYLQKNSVFEIQREYQTYTQDRLVRKIEKKVIKYTLMVIDEFQNYLPEQIIILKKCLTTETQSIVYVGDITQQIKLGTIQNWNEVNEVIEPDRDIRLTKVYRNTKNILQYIKNAGYQIDIPENLQEGPVVTEMAVHSPEDEMTHIKQTIQNSTEISIGILAQDESYLEIFKNNFNTQKNVHVMTILESQGVEFDTVFLVGIRKDNFVFTHDKNDPLFNYYQERKRIQKDLLYVAFTRAITELQVLGPEPLYSILS